MKKLLLVLSSLALVFSMVAVPLMVSATGPCAPDMVECCNIKVKFNLDGREINKGCYGPSCEGQTDNQDWGLVCLLGTIHHVTNWIFYIIMTIVMVMILAGAFMFLTSSGDTTKTSKATKTITYAIIGMVVALLARAIPVAVRYITGL